MSTLYSIGQMNQLAGALEKAGFTPDDVTKLRSSPLLPDFRRVLLGHAKLAEIKHIIDLDVNPSVPNGWEVEEHIKGGQLEWDPAKIALYLSETQRLGQSIDGHKLREELEGKPCYNANLLDFLLHYRELIPENLKGKSTFFWNTIYRYGGMLIVRGLSWDQDWDEGLVDSYKWSEIFRSLNDDFHPIFHPAAIAASSS